MPRCIECEVDISRTIDPETNTVRRCPNCGRRCDIYYEFSEVQICINLLLMQRRAWLHVLFNHPYSLKSCIIQALSACFLESFIARTLFVIRVCAKSDCYTRLPSDTFHDDAWTKSLQFVNVLQSPMMPMMNYMRTLPLFFLYSSVEYFLLIVIAVCTGKRFCESKDRYEDTLERWVRIVSMATTVKLSYILFLIWIIPTSIIVVVDVLFFMLLFRGFLSLFAGASWPRALPAVILCIAARIAYRQWTGWNSQLMI